MSKIFLLAIDLISKETFTKEDLEKFRSNISKIKEENEVLEVFSDISQLTKDGRIEIYAEDTGITCSSGEEILSLVKKVEKEIGGFISGSCFEVAKDHPGKSEKWIRSEYSWDSEESEDEEPWDKDTYWEDDWNEWNEEWN
jgi:hypothetical protein